jgi:hypothetical protein
MLEGGACSSLSWVRWGQLFVGEFTVCGERPKEVHVRL